MRRLNPFTFRTTRVFVVVASVLVVLLAVVEKFDSVREGLNATYFSDTQWSSIPVLSRIEPRPSSDEFDHAWSGRAPEAFSATWSGKLVLLRAGRYTFATESDDGSWVYVDGRLIVDNSGRHEAWRRSGSVDLDAGDHDLFIKYFQAGGHSTLRLLWGPDESSLKPVPSWAFVPRHAEFRRLAASVIVRRLHGLVLWIWLAALAVAVGAAAQRPFARWLGHLRSSPESLALTGIVVVSVGLNATGVWWGVPSGWAGDEITPKTVLSALEQGFSNGWWDRYPPFHMQVLSLTFAPWLILKSAHYVQATDPTEFAVLLVTSRLVSVTAAAGTLVAVFRLGREVFGVRAGLVAAAALSLLTPFLYYAKTANPEVPYVFWFAVSLVFYMRAQRTLAIRDFIGLALAAVLSVCTKDQAYGLYVLAPVPLTYALWRSHRAAGRSRPLVSALLDRRLWAAAAVGAALFAIVHNIPLNAAGFIKHVQDITGPGKEGYQIVPPSLAGRLELVRITANLNQQSWGWPLWILSLAGIAIALGDAKTRPAALALLLPAVAYYASFINVVRYAFDRYVLPACVIEAVFVGYVVDRMLAMQSPGAARAGRLAAVSAVAYTFLYAATLDVLMLRDARYKAEAWLRANGGADGLCGIVFPITVLPRLDGFATAVIRTAGDLREASPSYFILNADYAKAVSPQSPEGQLVTALQHETAGYRRAFHYRAPSPWPWLPAGHPNLTGPRTETPVLSVLTQVNPTIEIYAREPDAAAR